MKLVAEHCIVFVFVYLLNIIQCIDICVNTHFMEIKVKHSELGLWFFPPLPLVQIERGVLGVPINGKQPGQRSKSNV